jgi:hypothetical protein
MAAAGGVGAAGGGLWADGDVLATDGDDVGAGGGDAELHCTRTAPATDSVAIRQMPTRDERPPRDLI